MNEATATPENLPDATGGAGASAPVNWVKATGRRSLGFLHTFRGLVAFAFISLSVGIRKARVARAVLGPLTLAQLYRSGVRLLPMVCFLALVLGFLVIGQTVALMTRVGAQDFLGTAMVIVVVRELGPLLAALLVLSRTGMATVIELATARAMGEIEVLEVLGIDPIHYLVVPRLVGLSLGLFALAVYFILVSLGSGYLWAFIQDVPLAPGDYVRQLASALDGLDFVLLAVKTGAFGFIIALVCCYHGLARPLRLEEIPQVAIQATAQSVAGCLLLDALLIILYLAI